MKVTLFQRLSLEIERRWLLGHLNGEESVATCADEILRALVGEFPGALGNRHLALEEIRGEILRVRRILSYGGRRTEDVVPGRRDFVVGLDPFGLRAEFPA